MTSQFVPKTTPLMITTKFCNTVLRNKAQARDHDNLQLEVLGRKCGTCGLRNQGARGTNLHPEGKQHQISIGFAQKRQLKLIEKKHCVGVSMLEHFMASNKVGEKRAKFSDSNDYGSLHRKAQFGDPEEQNEDNSFNLDTNQMRRFTSRTNTSLAPAEFQAIY
ncbi:hypothetical protein GLOIN_2v1476228 [Rhizophagus irregularis DAOM 181602=DAOM 197198]|uniref:Uncharacterized protein n=1 Tax=Rhizophagus irregularis (strain DAOM 181602 / DAOM 197198 / MUCL 43194) TaxID=747089 RepID=A0A2P4Q9T0_RHIID|nr:hypothetical protein GLOIN_2v1476228 [Rhizophagus irregularis DAOM 181602=DAOM 197198]POG74405.1 hypothetical protein GLOIN_2v1476228 [Rhizophagus irregularis DAOM 181602=DAOM 197198]|eukprot:XP_025181271.1 hypothetical protein GLOIN_2v1476228 [Rhizophagus irregularis DAOM 181602=DAOM 197198]